MKNPHHEVEDCPIDVQNRSEGWKPKARLTIWKKDSEPGKILFHICGVEDLTQLAAMLRFLAVEMDREIQKLAEDEEKPPPKR